MKKIDYYAIQQPWRMPKWLGAALGGIFGVIAIGSVAAIVHLTSPPTPAPTAAVAAAVPTSPAAAVPTTTTAAAPAVAPAPTVASAEPMAAPAAKHSRHHASHRHHKAMRVASAKRASARRATILAKHDSKQKRHEKDALDKLLGL